MICEEFLKKRFDFNTKIETFLFAFSIAQNLHQQTKFRLEKQENNFIIWVKSENLNLQEEFAIFKILTKILNKEAKNYLPKRLSDLAKLHEFEFSSVKINGAFGRWGSCSSKKNINLSYFMILLPPQVIDFVLVHELCHTKEMNHGANFKLLLKSKFKNFNELEQMLKKSSLETIWLKKYKMLKL